MIVCSLLNVQLQIFDAYSGQEQVQQYIKNINRNEGEIGQMGQYILDVTGKLGEVGFDKKN